MKVMVTGAAGFIGSHILAALRESAVEVVAVDAMIPQAHGVAARTDSTRNGDDEIHRVDVNAVEQICELMRGVDVVCHQAAMVGMGVDISDAPLYARHNDLGTASILAAMDTTGCGRLVMASSMVVYGHGRLCDSRGTPVAVPAPRLPADFAVGDYEYHAQDGSRLTWELTGEDTAPAPRSIYAASKVAQESYAQAWALSTGGSVIALRYHNVYGPNMPRDTPYAGVASIFRSQLAAEQAPIVFEDGQQMRDFVHVKDVASANLAAITRPIVGFTALNICSGRPTSIGSVAQTLAREVDGPQPIMAGTVRAGDVRHIVADPSRARRLLGFDAEIGPESGLAEFARARLRVSAGGR